MRETQAPRENPGAQMVSGANGPGRKWCPFIFRFGHLLEPLRRAPGESRGANGVSSFFRFGHLLEPLGALAWVRRN